MSSRVTLSRVIGLVFLVAALGSGYGSASAATGETPQGLKADGLRWQAMANHYIQLRGTTPLGLKADALRYQAMARFYANRPAASFYTPQALKADGLRWQAMARFYAAPSTSTRSSSTGFNWGSAAIGAPAATRPLNASPGRTRDRLVGRIARADLPSRVINPFFSSAFRWHITPLGDLISNARDPLEDCIAELSRLRAPLGVWGCHGNHEHWAGMETKAQALFARYGMHLLRQQCVALSWHGGHFNLIGVDDQRLRREIELHLQLLRLDRRLHDRTARAAQRGMRLARRAAGRLRRPATHR